jgi:integrase
VDRRKTVAAARDEYLAHLEGLAGTKGEKSVATIEDVRSKLDGYIVPALGPLKLSALRDREIEKLAHLARGRSQSTMRSILSVASGFFAWAIREGNCEQNPVARAREVFGDSLLPDDEPKPQRALTDDEFLTAFNRVSETYRPIIGLKAETGWRISEVLGMRLGHLKLDEATATVVEQLGRNGQPGARTKSKRVREVALSDAAVAILREHIRKERRRGVLGVDPQALVFQTRTGKPHSRRNVLRAWKKALAEVGIEDAHLHSLRHSFVSRLEERNVSVAIAKELVGHSMITTTQAVYTQLRGDRDVRLTAQRKALRQACVDARQEGAPVGAPSSSRLWSSASQLVVDGSSERAGTHARRLVHCAR